MRLRLVEIKPEECLTHGCCVYELPEVFEMLDDGTFCVRPDASDLFDSLQYRIEEVAGNYCPVMAIRLEYEDGSERYPKIELGAVPPAVARETRFGWGIWCALAIVISLLLWRIV